jgi:hypothetical protein
VTNSHLERIFKKCNESIFFLEVITNELHNFSEGIHVENIVSLFKVDLNFRDKLLVPVPDAHLLKELTVFEENIIFVDKVKSALYVILQVQNEIVFFICFENSMLIKLSVQFKEVFIAVFISDIHLLCELSYEFLFVLIIIYFNQTVENFEEIGHLELIIFGKVIGENCLQFVDSSAVIRSNTNCFSICNLRK